MKTTPKDFFLHLGATIALYVSAIALINLAFTTINYALPDQLASYFYADSLVWPISILIVLTPILYAIEWFIARDLRLMPEKRELWIRRWRIYLTLFLTGATIAGDLIALINTYLNGEITNRFIWKVLAVLIVCAVIFAYYILDKMTDLGRGRIWKKVLAWLGIIVVLSGIIGGFNIVGSPAKQRAIRFDDTRIMDLTNIQYGIADYWQRTGKLPENIKDLNDPIYGYTVPSDPEWNVSETKASYQYIKKGPQSFDLCATFSLSSDVTKSNVNRGSGISMPAPYPASGGGLSGNWDHPAGHSCFTRTIDPLRYPVNIPPKM